MKLLNWSLIGIATFNLTSGVLLFGTSTIKGTEMDSADHTVTVPKLREAVAVGPYCGIYSLWCCLNTVGIKLPADKLTTLEYVGSHRGSSASELVKAAEDCGGYAKGFTNVTLADIEQLNRPAILHMRSSWIDHGYNHWIAFMGLEEGGRVRVFDPPHPLNTVSYSELLANWDGLAIVISESPINSSLLDGARMQGQRVLCMRCRMMRRQSSCPVEIDLLFGFDYGIVGTRHSHIRSFRLFQFRLDTLGNCPASPELALALAQEYPGRND
jgi:predicted double-glycine peptidase